ncbi:MAG TPA: hypothetical protein VJH94_05075 [Candidatus Paceibacterota bacterium]
MGFFGPDRGPHVSRDEFHNKVKSDLHAKGFNHRELEQLEGYFHWSLHEEGSQKGIDKHEVERTVDWLREHRQHHSFSDEQIEHINHALRKHL